VGDIPRVHLVGRKNQGKTTLMVELVEELVRRGIRVGTIKHTLHSYELDTPGTDSYRHQEAGGNPAAFISGPNTAVYLTGRPGADPYEQILDLFADCDLILVEGDVSSSHPRVEVWREDIGEPPIAEEAEISVLVSDDHVDFGVVVWPRSDISVIATSLLNLAGISV